MHPSVAAALALSFALLGDALLYAVLPTHGPSLGWSAGFIGLLLGINRGVRVLGYGALGVLSARLGPRQTSVIGVALAIASTCAYGLSKDPVVWVIARVGWGVAFALLQLTMLLAASRAERAGAQVGWAMGLSGIGPLVILLAGPTLVRNIGPFEVFLWLAGVSAMAVLFIPALPTAPEASSRGSAFISRPSGADVATMCLSLSVDGALAPAVGFILARGGDVEAGVAAAAAVLLTRRVGALVLAPLAGQAVDRLGAWRVLALLGSLACASLLLCIWALLPGAILATLFATAAKPATTLAATECKGREHSTLANNQAYRDLGAGVGPFLALSLLGSVDAPLVLGGAALLAGLGAALGFRGR